MPTQNISNYHRYYARPELTWFNGKRKPHSNPMDSIKATECIGAEVETEFPYNTDRNAVAGELKAAMGMTETECGRLMIETDGSLVNGIECISFPATFGCHRQCYGWGKFFEVLNSYNPVAYGTEVPGYYRDAKCGLHFHVSRASLGTTEDAQELCIAKLLYMFDHFTTMFGKIGGRSYTNNSYCEANRAGIEPTDKSAVAVFKAKTHAQDGNRYHAINLTNQATIEFRIFAQDNRYDHFLARMEFVHWIVDYCKSNTITTVYAETAASLKSKIRALNPDHYGELIALVNEIYGA